MPARLRVGDERRDGGADALHQVGRVFRRAAVEFDSERVDHPARADDVVRRPEDAPFVEQVGHRVVGELVVRRTGDDRAAQLGYERRGEHAAERGRHKHVDIRGERRGRFRPGGAEFVGQCPLGLVDVAEHQVRTVGRERRRDPRPPTRPSPTTANRFPLTDPPVSARSVATTPAAVCGEESPLPPLLAGRQNTCAVRSASTSMSGSPVPTSGPVA
jgi:hypothetical protein